MDSCTPCAHTQTNTSTHTHTRTRRHTHARSLARPYTRTHTHTPSHVSHRKMMLRLAEWRKRWASISSVACSLGCITASACACACPFPIAYAVQMFVPCVHVCVCVTGQGLYLQLLTRGSAANSVGLLSSLFATTEKGEAAESQNQALWPIGQAPLSAACPGLSGSEDFVKRCMLCISHITIDMF